MGLLVCTATSTAAFAQASPIAIQSCTVLQAERVQRFWYPFGPVVPTGAPYSDGIRIVYINDSAVAFQSYQKGELDAVTLAPEDLATVKSNSDLSSQFIQVAGSCNFYFGFNTKKAPFDNVKVRQAFAQA